MPDASLAIPSVIFLLFLQLGVLGWLGEVVTRGCWGASPWRARLPEMAFLAGWAAYALVGWVVLLATGSAVPVLPVVVALCAAGTWFLRSGDRGNLAIWEPYRQFRATVWGQAALAAAVMLAVCVGSVRLLWLLGMPAGGTVPLGTNIWDDMRTVGFPLSLAAHGYPLMSPYAVDIRLAYPVGAFLFPASVMVLEPSLALPSIVMDSFAAGLFYGLVVVVASSFARGHGLLRLLASLSAILSVSYNLWRIDLDRSSRWFDELYGYYKWNSYYTTVAWMPFNGMIWIPNHGIGFAAVVLVMLVFGFRRLPDRLERGEFSLCLLFAGYAAITSMDMTAMALVAGGLMLVSAGWCEGRWTAWRLMWFRQGLGVCLAAFVLLSIVNWPTLSKQVDAQFETPFPLLTRPWFNVGVMLSTLGPYFLLLLLGLVLLRSRFWRAGGFLWIPLLVTLWFCAVFEYHSIWYWRSTFAMHLLLGLLCAGVAAALGRRGKAAFAGLWILALFPGTGQTLHDVKGFSEAVPRLPMAKGEAVRWIYRHTPLSARVVAFDRTGWSLAPDVNLLRTGDRAGKVVFDRIHPLIGYQAYLRRMSDLPAGIAANDYILYYNDRPEFSALLEMCGAPVVYENSQARIFHVDRGCRQRLKGPETAPLMARYESARVRAEAKGVPLTSGAVRLKAEQFWATGRFADAVRFLTTVAEEEPGMAEAAYSLAFSYQGAGEQAKAIAMYTRALELGYAEFWVRYNRGAAYLDLGDKEKARRDLLRARELDSSHAGVRQLLTRLGGETR